MDININFRQNQLLYLQNYFTDVDTEVSMILQNIQWDRRYLMEQGFLVVCQYDTNHRVPPDKLEAHENGCFLKTQGYADGDRFLPSPLDLDATTLVKLNNIADIISNASPCQPSFVSVLIGSFGCDRTYPYVKSGCSGPQPLTIERLQATYTRDERRAIHDAVVNQVPACHDLSELALVSSKDVGKESNVKSKLEILAELRDMRRRRTKYRVAAKTRNYSDVLRDVITTQMELYTQTHNSMTENHIKINDTNSKAGDYKSKDKTASKYCDNSNKTQNKSYCSNERHTSSFSKNMYDMSQRPKSHDDYEIRKRRHKDSSSVYNSTKYSTQEHDKSTSSRDDRYKEYYNSKKKKKDCAKSDRSSHKYNCRYGNYNTHIEKTNDRKKELRVKQHNLNIARDETKDNNHYNKLREKCHSHERHHSYRVTQDKYENKNLSVTSKNDVYKQKSYEHKKKQDQTVSMKKEKDDCYDDYSNSSESNETDYSKVTSQYRGSHYFNVKKIKVEKDFNVKMEGNRTGNDSGKNYGSKSLNMFHQKSKGIHDRLSDSTTQRKT